MDLTELLPDWLNKDQIDGASCDLAQGIFRDLDRAVVPCGSQLFGTLGHLGTLRNKPPFFRSASQSWEAFGVYDILVVITDMMMVRHRYSYRNVLTRLQDDLRRENMADHTLWVYDELNRRQLHKGVSLGVEVNPKISFAQINLEVLRATKIYEKEFARLLSQPRWSSMSLGVVARGIGNNGSNRPLARIQFFGRDGLLLRGKQNKLA